MSNENAAAAMDKLVKDMNKREFDRGYEKGMEDCWEMVKRIVFGSTILKDAYTVNELKDIFGRPNLENILLNNSAKEAKGKIDNYIKQRDGKFHVGDEIIYSTEKFVIINLDYEDIEKNGICFYAINNSGVFYLNTIFHKGIKKTGRHFEEVETLFNKLKEDNSESNKE